MPASVSVTQPLPAAGFSGICFNVVFEYDSDENVKANYQGDYFRRLV